jgi:ATP-binding cassette subfamily F protein uup
LLIVSHDRYFLNRICSSMLVFEGNSQITLSEGNYDYYLEKKKRLETPALAESNAEDKVIPGGRRAVRKLKWKEEQELSGIEASIAAAERELERVEAVFSSPEFFKLRADRPKLEAELEAARARTQTLYARWEELESIKRDFEAARPG